MSHDPNLGFVAAAYGLAFLVIGGMAGAVLLDTLRLKRALSLLPPPRQSQNAEDQSGDQDAAPHASDPESFE
jgi:hypothetical protein